MDIKILSKRENPLLKRIEVTFNINHEVPGSTPSRPAVRKAVATSLKKKEELIFIKKIKTKTGTQITFGSAHIYDSADQAEFYEQKHILKRNNPPEKTE
jgi:ribosomal protein S24E